MLRIKSSGIYLNLPDNIQVNITIENPFMLNDRVPSPYSLTFSLPDTPTNLKATNYPNRCTMINRFPELPCQIEFETIVFLTGVLLVKEYADNVIKVNFRGSIYPENIFKKLNKISLQQYDFGRGSSLYPHFNTPGDYAYNYKALMQNAIAGNENFVVAPIRIKGTSFDGHSGPFRAGESGTELGKELYFNFFNARNDTWFVGDHMLMYPMPYLHYLVDQVFDGILESNPFTSGDLAKIVMVSTYHPGYPGSKLLLDNAFPVIPPMTDNLGRPRRITEADIIDAYKADTFLKLNSFLPDLAANEFLKSLLKMFCATLYPIGNKFRIVPNADILNSAVVESWTDKLIGTLDTLKTDAQVYNYGYQDVTEDPDTAAISLTLPNITDLLAETVESITTEDGAKFLIQSTGQVYKKKWVEGEAEYELISSGLGGKKDSDNAYSMISEVSPLSMDLGKYWWQLFVNPTILKADWYVPQWTGERTERPTKASLMLYHGLVNTFTAGDQYPLLSSHNVDQFGTKHGDLSLSWNGADGLLEKYHTEFKAWVEKDKIAASGEFLLTAIDLRNLELTTKKHINGRLFYIEKINITLRKKNIDPALISFIEA